MRRRAQGKWPGCDSTFFTAKATAPASAAARGGVSKSSGQKEAKGEFPRISHTQAGVIEEGRRVGSGRRDARSPS